MILSPDERVTSLGIDRERFAIEAQKKWPDGRLVHVTGPDWIADVTMQVERPGESPFQVFRHRSGKVISTDGDAEQVEEVGLWIASLLIDTLGGRVWLCDDGFSGHVELRRGMTGQELRDGWVDHGEHPPEFRDKDGNIHTVGE